MSSHCLRLLWSPDNNTWVEFVLKQINCLIPSYGLTRFASNLFVTKESHKMPVAFMRFLFYLSYCWLIGGWSHYYMHGAAPIKQYMAASTQFNPLSQQIIIYVWAKLHIYWHHQECAFDNNSITWPTSSVLGYALGIYGLVLFILVCMHGVCRNLR